MDQQSAKAPRTRLRWSLSTVFLWVTLLTLATSHFYTSLRAVRLNNELSRMRRTFGYPEVHNRNEVATGYVHMGAAGFWRYRVFKPAGKSLVVRCATKDIGNEWLPPHDHECRVKVDHDQEAEFFVDIAVKEKDGGYAMLVQCDVRLWSGFEAPLSPDNPFVRLTTTKVAKSDAGKAQRFGLQTWSDEFQLWETSDTTNPKPHLLFAYCSGTREELKSGPGGSLYPGVAVWLQEAPP